MNKPLSFLTAINDAIKEHQTPSTYLYMTKGIIEIMLDQPRRIYWNNGTSDASDRLLLDCKSGSVLFPKNCAFTLDVNDDVAESITIKQPGSSRVFAKIYF